MKVGILSIASPDWGGVYQYTLSLLESMKQYANKHRYVQIRNTTFPRILDNDFVIPKERIDFILKLKIILHAFTDIKLGNMMPSINSTLLNNIDLVISPIISLLPSRIGKPYIVTIHDFQHKYYPEFFTLKEKISREIIYTTGRKANIVICESEYVKKDIIHFLKLPERKISIMLSPPPSYRNNLATNTELMKKIKSKYNLPERYLFYPAQFWLHKNHMRLLESIALLKDKHNLIIPLMLTGSKQNSFDPVMHKIRELMLEGQVKYLGYVPDNDMPYLYKLSTALIMPSLFESVSMPIWEAFHLGSPVVSSNICALPEQVGNAGLLFNPNNTEDIADKISSIWGDNSLRQELIRKGYERIKDLTLENYARQWEKIIEEALSRGSLQ